MFGRRKNLLALMGVGLSLTLAGSGCGSGTKALLGFNSDAVVSLTTRDIADLELSISPRQGSPSASDTCDETQANFGCSREFRTDQTTYRFTTSSDASTSPYYVYVINRAGSRRTAAFEVRMDGDQKLQFDFEIAPGATERIARILRNSADEN